MVIVYNKSSQIGQRIRQVMQNSGYTQQQWAAMLRVSQPSVSFYLKGRVPPLETVIRICEILNISLDTLVQTEEPHAASRLAEQNPGYFYSRRFEVLFSQLNESQKQAVLQLMETMIKQEQPNE